MGDAVERGAPGETRGGGVGAGVDGIVGLFEATSTVSEAEGDKLASLFIKAGLIVGPKLSIISLTVGIGVRVNVGASVMALSSGTGDACEKCKGHRQSN